MKEQAEIGVNYVRFTSGNLNTLFNLGSVFKEESSPRIRHLTRNASVKDIKFQKWKNLAHQDGRLT